MLANARRAGCVPPLRAAIPAALLLVFAAYVTIGLKRFTFAGAIDGVDPVPVGMPASTKNGTGAGEGAGTGADAGAGAIPMPAGARTADETFATRCATTCASEFSLTPREAEVFAMYSPAAAIAPTSRKNSSCPATPVKARVKHIYAKLDIHSHQELLDLVEGSTLPSGQLLRRPVNRETVLDAEQFTRLSSGFDRQQHANNE